MKHSLALSSRISHGGCKVKDIADGSLRIKINAVVNLPVEDQFAGLSAVERVRLVNALGVHQVRKLVDGAARNPVVFKAHRHIEVMPFTALRNAGTGVFLIDFSEGIPVSLLQLPVVNKHRAKSNGIQDIMILDILFHILPGTLLAHVHKIEVAGCVDQEGVNRVILVVAACINPFVKPVKLPVVNRDAEVPLEIQIRIDGSDSIGLRCKKMRCQISYRCCSE